MKKRTHVLALVTLPGPKSRVDMVNGLETVFVSSVWHGGMKPFITCGSRTVRSCCSGVGTHGEQRECRIQLAFSEITSGCSAVTEAPICAAGEW